MMPRRLRVVKIWIILVAVVPSITQGKIFLLDLLNASTVEQSAIQEAVGDINDQLVSNGSSFTLHLRNASKQSDLSTHSSSLASTDVIALLDFNVLPYYACTTSTVTKTPVFRFHGSENFYLRTECNSITISADYFSFAQASIELLDAFKWKKIVLMAEPSRFSEAGFFEAFTTNKDYTLSFIQLVHEYNGTKKKCSCERAMKKVAELGADVILLFVKEKSPILITEGCDPKKTFVWIIQDLVSSDVFSARDRYMVLGFGLPTDNNPRRKRKHADTFGLAYDAVMLIAMTLNRIHENGSWLPGKSNATFLSNKETFYKHIKQMRINGHTSTVKFEAKGRRVVENLRILNLVNNTFIEIGHWSNSGPFLTLTDRIHFNDASLDGVSLTGRQIDVVTIVAEPFVMRTVSNDGRAIFRGFCIDILEKLASDLKFTYKIKLVDDGQYGTLINGEWNGMIRELIDGKAEMIVAPLTRTVERQQYVAMTAGFMYYADKMMMKKTYIEEKAFFQFMLPFSVSVWVVMGAILVAVALAMYILNYLSPYGYKNDQGTKTSEEFNLFNSIWFAAACMLQQGADHAPKALSGRILAGFFWFAILVWVSTFTANLVAFFTVERFIKPVRNFKEAIESGYELGVNDNSPLKTMFTTAESDLYKRAWNRMKRFPSNTSQAIEWMRNGLPYIHLEDGPTLDHLIKAKCDLITIPGLQTPRSYVFAMRLNDQHVHEISHAVLHLRENGFIQKSRYQHWDGLNECHEKNTNSIKEKTLQLDNVTGMFIVLGMGFLVSLLTLAIEIYWHRAGKQKITSLKEKTANDFKRKRTQRIVVAETNKAIQDDSSDTTISHHISA